MQKHYAPGIEKSTSPFETLREVYSNRCIANAQSFRSESGDVELADPVVAQFEALADKQFLRHDPQGDGNVRYVMTPTGLMALRHTAERALRDGIGRPIEARDVQILRAVEEGASFAGVSLGDGRPSDYCERIRITVWGQVGTRDEPVMLARATLHRMDVDAAHQVAQLPLESLFEAHPETASLIPLIQNHDVDGEPAHTAYELAEMFGLPEAIGRHFIVLTDIHLAPAFIGMGLGREIMRRLVLRYGSGNGLIIFPLTPYAQQPGDPEFDMTCECITAGVGHLGLVDHPFEPNCLVGDIRTVSGLAG